MRAMRREIKNALTKEQRAAVDETALHLVKSAGDKGAQSKDLVSGVEERLAKSFPKYLEWSRIVGGATQRLKKQKKIRVVRGEGNGPGGTWRAS